MAFHKFIGKLGSWMTFHRKAYFTGKHGFSWRNWLFKEKLGISEGQGRMNFDWKHDISKGRMGREAFHREACGNSMVFQGV